MADYLMLVVLLSCSFGAEKTGEWGLADRRHSSVASPQGDVICCPSFVSPPCVTHRLPALRAVSIILDSSDMDGPVPEDFVILAPGRPEPVVSLQWRGPENNGLDVCR